MKSMPLQTPNDRFSLSLLQAPSQCRISSVYSLPAFQHSFSSYLWVNFSGSEALAYGKSVQFSKVSCCCKLATVLVYFCSCSCLSKVANDALPFGVSTFSGQQKEYMLLLMAICQTKLDSIKSSFSGQLRAGLVSAAQFYLLDQIRPGSIVNVRLSYFTFILLIWQTLTNQFYRFEPISQPTNERPLGL